MDRRLELSRPQGMSTIMTRRQGVLQSQGPFFTSNIMTTRHKRVIQRSSTNEQLQGLRRHFNLNNATINVVMSTLPRVDFQSLRTGLFTNLVRAYGTILNRNNLFTISGNSTTITTNPYLPRRYLRTRGIVQRSHRTIVRRVVSHSRQRLTIRRLRRLQLMRIRTNSRRTIRVTMTTILGMTRTLTTSVIISGNSIMTIFLNFRLRTVRRNKGMFINRTTLPFVRRRGTRVMDAIYFRKANNDVKRMTRAIHYNPRPFSYNEQSVQLIIRHLTSHYRQCTTFLYRVFRKQRHSFTSFQEAFCKKYSPSDPWSFSRFRSDMFYAGGRTRGGGFRYF